MRKKGLLFTLAAAVGLTAGPALAADIAVKAPVYKAPPPASVSTWTGCYIGGNLGGGWNHKHFDFPFGGGLFDEGTLNQGGFVGGGQLGCDYQFGSSFVVGVQGMFDGTTIKGTETFFSGIDQINERYAVDLHWFGTLTGRVGFLATPSLLLYGKGGVAWVNEKIDYVPGQEVVASTGNTTRSGWDAGAGIEWMFAPQWTAFVEYNHMDFGTKDKNLYFVADGSFDFTERVKQSVDMVVVGVNWRFNSTTPGIGSSRY
jgi:outer membrane immunogenic protein